MTALWIAAFAQAAAWVVTGASLPWTVEQPMTAGRLLLAIPLGVYAINGAAAALGLLSVILLIVWLYRARSNVDTFSDSRSDWALGWTIGAWFIPVANRLLPAMVIADVARNSSDDPVGRGTSAVAARVWTWWVLRLLQPIVGGLWLFVATPMLVGGLGRYADLDRHMVFTVVGPLVGVVIALAAGRLGSRVVGGVSREQRYRVERMWAGSVRPDSLLTDAA
jgi:hypothetical protein